MKGYYLYFDDVHSAFRMSLYEGDLNDYGCRLPVVQLPVRIAEAIRFMDRMRYMKAPAIRALVCLVCEELHLKNWWDTNAYPDVSIPTSV